MTRITSSDQVLVLLREQLRRLGRGAAGASARSARTGDTAAPAMARMKALAERDSVGEEELRRTLVRALLTEELGDALANEPALQNVFDDVARIIGTSPEGAELLDRALRQLRDGR
jgi:hypothetical protein